MEVKLLPGKEPWSEYSSPLVEEERSQSESTDSEKMERMVGRTNLSRFSLTRMRSVIRVDK
jgi:hypothetical protein